MAVERDAGDLPIGADGLAPAGGRAGADGLAPAGGRAGADGLAPADGPAGADGLAGADGSAGARSASTGTGEPRVDAALARLDELADLPVSEHPAVFEHVHGRLSEVLGELDTGPADGRQGQAED